METEQATIQWLNLLHASPSFVIRVGHASEKPIVRSAATVPDQDGEYWVAGKTDLKSGRTLDSVFRVDTDASGTLIAAFWMIAGDWWDFQDRPQIFSALNMREEEVFPFSWTYAVPLENDLYRC